MIKKYLKGSEFHNGFAVVKTVNNTNIMIDKFGNESKISFNHSGRYNDGFAQICTKDPISGEYRYYYLDENLELRFGPFESASNFSNGVAQVVENGKIKYLKTDGEYLEAKFKFNSNCEPFVNGYAIVYIEDEFSPYYTFMNPEGKYLDFCLDEKPTNFDECGFAKIKEKKLLDDATSVTTYKFINDKDNGTSLRPDLSIAKASDFKNGFASISTTNFKKGFLSTTGKFISLSKYFSVLTEEITKYHDPICVYDSSKGDYVFVDVSGKKLFRFDNKSEDVHAFYNGLAIHEDYRDMTKKEKTWNYVDKNFNVVISDDNFNYLYSFTDDDIARVEYKDSTIGYIDKTGKKINHLKLKSGKDFKNGMAKVELLSNENEFTFINTDGTILPVIVKNSDDYFVDDFVRVTNPDNTISYLHKSGYYIGQLTPSKLGETNLSSAKIATKLNRLEKFSPKKENLDVKQTPLTDTEKIKNWIDSGESVLLRGPSGIGKTERIKSLYPDAIYIKLTNNMFPEKVVGSINLQTGENIPPAFAKELLLKYATKEEKEKIAQNVQYLYDCADEIYERSKNSSSKSVILLDELLNVKPAIQSLVYNIVLNKVVEAGSGLKLPANTVVVATGNQKKYSQVAEDLAEPLEKRFDHILDMEPKVNEWIQEYAIPNNIHPTVVGYLLCKYQENNKSENLDKIGYFYEEPDVAEKHLDKNGCKGKTNDPRGWASVSRSLYNFEKNLKDGKYIGKDVESILKTSLDTKLRDEWSGDFFDFYNNPTLSPQDIVDNNYTDDDIPTSINDKFATVYGLLNSTEEQIPTVKKFIKKHCSKEYLTLFEEFLSEKNDIENTSNDTTNLELDTDSHLSTESEMTN